MFSSFDCGYFFFFFKQKTAYEMRISDWSSDVCSSDLIEGLEVTLDYTNGYNEQGMGKHSRTPLDGVFAYLVQYKGEHVMILGFSIINERSEERGGGRERVSTCRSRLSQDH